MLQSALNRIASDTFFSVLVSAVHVVVNLLLVGARTSIVLATVTGGSDASLATLEVDDGNSLGGELAALDSGQADIGTVVVVLGQDVGGPGPNEQALVLGSARGHVLGDSHGPLVVGIGARLGVATDETEGLSAIIRQGKLASSTTVTSLGELAVGGGDLGLLGNVLGLHARGVEADGDDLTGLHVGDLAARGITTAREAHSPLAVFVANPGVEATVVLLGANTTTGRWVEKTHVGGGRGDQGDEKDEDCSELHVDGSSVGF